MMPQVWFEMAEIHRRKFAAAAWMPLRTVQPICEEGTRGHLGFKEEFFGNVSLAVPDDLKEIATKLIGLMSGSVMSTLPVSTMGATYQSTCMNTNADCEMRQCCDGDCYVA